MPTKPIRASLCTKPSGECPGSAPVVVIGGGFAGAAVARQLALQSSGPTRITMIEPSVRLGRGVAYGSGQGHLLNVPAGRLSCDPGLPGDFHAWCVAAGRNSTPGAFLPRAWFGEYAECRLSEAVERSGGRVQLQRLRDTAIGLRAEGAGVEVATRHGTVTRGAHAVLALGLGPTRWPEALKAWREDDRVAPSPWDKARMARAARSSRRVLLVGTGLTMCDAAIALMRVGFEGELVAVSRRGVTPEPHGSKDETAHQAWAAGLQAEPLPRLMRRVRERAAGSEWRGVIDSLRPHTQRLWSSMSGRDRARFVARASVYWDGRRHRCPPEVHDAVSALRRQGRLRVVAGGIERVEEGEDGLRAWVAPRGGGPCEPLEVGAVVLCTGPEPDPSRWGSALMDGLIRDGLVSVDPLSLGVRSDTDGSVIGPDGRADPRLSVVGALRRGDLWESTAVPEIAQQAAVLAPVILSRARAHAASLQSRIETKELLS